jgi:hypothetical protein
MLKMRQASHYACTGHMKNILKTITPKPEGNRYIERSRRKWENIKPDLKHTVCETVERITLVQNRIR